MHEFSLAMEVITLAEKEAEKANAASISEITIEIGTLSGVEANAFETALAFLSTNTMLQNSRVQYILTKGDGFCPACSLHFEMNSRMDTCPRCRSFPSEVKGGDAFKVHSLLVDN